MNGILTFPKSAPIRFLRNSKDKYVYWHPRGVLNSSNSAYESMNSVLGIERMLMAMFKYPKVERCFGIEMEEQNGAL